MLLGWATHAAFSHDSLSIGGFAQNPRFASIRCGSMTFDGNVLAASCRWYLHKWKAGVGSAFQARRRLTSPQFHRDLRRPAVRRPPTYPALQAEKSRPLARLLTAACPTPVPMEPSNATISSIWANDSDLEAKVRAQRDLVSPKPLVSWWRRRHGAACSPTRPLRLRCRFSNPR
jgi:hypothetical protein